MQEYTLGHNSKGRPFKRCTICQQMLEYIIIPGHIPDEQRCRYTREIAIKENYILANACPCKKEL